MEPPHSNVEDVLTLEQKVKELTERLERQALIEQENAELKKRLDSLEKQSLIQELPSRSLLSASTSIPSPSNHKQIEDTISRFEEQVMQLKVVLTKRQPSASTPPPLLSRSIDPTLYKQQLQQEALTKDALIESQRILKAKVDTFEQKFSSIKDILLDISTLSTQSPYDNLTTTTTKQEIIQEKEKEKIIKEEKKIEEEQLKEEESHSLNNVIDNNNVQSQIKNSIGSSSEQSTDDVIVTEIKSEEIVVIEEESDQQNDEIQEEFDNQSNEQEKQEEKEEIVVEKQEESVLEEKVLLKELIEDKKESTTTTTTTIVVSETKLEEEKKEEEEDVKLVDIVVNVIDNNPTEISESSSSSATTTTTTPIASNDQSIKKPSIFANAFEELSSLPDVPSTIPVLTTKNSSSSSSNDAESTTNNNNNNNSPNKSTSSNQPSSSSSTNTTPSSSPTITPLTSTDNNSTATGASATAEVTTTFNMKVVSLNDNIIREGSLRKKGGGEGGRRNWTTRWFRLKHDTLSYYKKRKDSKPKGEIKLCQAKVETHSGKPFGIVLLSGINSKGLPRDYLLMAESKKEQDEWIQVINDVINKIPIQGTTPVSSISTTVLTSSTSSTKRS